MEKRSERLKQRRLKQKLTMDELAEKVGYTSASKRTIIYQIETGKADLAISKIHSYATALETNIYYLMGLSDVADLTDDDILNLIHEAYGIETEKKG